MNSREVSLSLAVLPTARSEFSKYLAWIQLRSHQTHLILWSASTNTKHFQKLQPEPFYQVQCPAYYYSALKPRVLIKLIPCSTKKLVEQSVPASVILYPVLLTMENTIFKLVLWDRAQDFAGSDERSDITSCFECHVSECSEAPYIRGLCLLYVHASGY